MKEQLDLLKLIIKRELNVDVKARSRVFKNVEARQIFIYIAFKRVQLSTPTRLSIYLEFNHASILHHHKKAKNWVEFDKHFKNDVKHIEDLFLKERVYLSKENTEERIKALEAELKILKSKVNGHTKIN